MPLRSPVLLIENTLHKIENNIRKIENCIRRAETPEDNFQLLLILIH